MQKVQSDILTLKTKIDAVENKLIILTVSLLAVVIGIFLLTQHFGLHIIFFIMSLFIAAMIFYIGTYAFRYEYQDELTTTIFANTLKCIDEKGAFIGYSDLNKNAKKSGFFLLYDLFIVSSTIQQYWAFNIQISNKKTTVASIYIDFFNLENPIFINKMNKGLFISIETHTSWIDEIYIYEKNIFPSLEQLRQSLKKDFSPISTYSDNHTVITKSLNSLAEEKLLKVLNELDSDMSLAVVDKQIFLFISKEFRCFDSKYYIDGKIPNEFDYKGLIEVLKTINKILNDIS
ncbi:MAG: hypothetical protein V2A75_07655 [Pseudomonadota bacterium]